MKKPKDKKLQDSNSADLANLAEFKERMGSLYTDVSPEGYTINTKQKNTVPYTPTPLMDSSLFTVYPELFSINYELSNIHPIRSRK